MRSEPRKVGRMYRRLDVQAPTTKDIAPSAAPHGSAPEPTGGSDLAPIIDTLVGA